MLDVIKLKYTTGWHQVWYNNRIAYVKSSAVGTLYGKKMSIKTSKAVMKTAASSSSSTVYTLVRGASVQVYSYTGNYAYINYKGLTGYVYKSALKLAAAGAEPVKINISGGCIQPYGRYIRVLISRRRG